MAEALRTLSIVLELVDNATKKLNQVKESVDELQQQEIQIPVTADASTVKMAAVSTGELSEKTKSASGAVERLRGIFDSLKISIDSAKNRIKDFTDAIDRARMPLLGLQAVTTGLIYSSAKAAASEEELFAALQVAFKGSYESMKKWVIAADEVSGVTRNQRIEMALLLKQAGMTDEKILEYTKTLEQFWKNPALRYKAQAAGITSLTELASQLKMAEIGGGRALPLQRMFGEEKMEDVIKYGHGARTVIKLMNKDIQEAGSVSATTAKRMRNFSEVLSEFQSSLGYMFLPTLSTILELLTKFIMTINKIPGAKEIIVLTTVFGLLLSTILLAAGAVGHLILGISNLLVVMKFIPSAIAAIKAAIVALTGTMAINPVIAALMILLGVIIALEFKFKLFSRALDALEKVNWAEALIGALQTVKSVIDYITGGVSKISGFLTGGKPIKLLAVVSPVGTAILGLIYKLAETVYNELSRIFPDQLNFVKLIYEEIKKRFNEAVKFLQNLIPGWLSKIFEKIEGLWNWIKGIWAVITSWFRIPWKEKEETGKPGGKAPAPLSEEELLKQYKEKYNLTEAQGLAGGVPVPGVEGYPGRKETFGGEFKQYAFRNPQGVVRTGAELSEEQLLTGLWEPVSLIDAATKGFIRELSEEERKAIQERLEAKKKALEEQKRPRPKEPEEEEYHIPQPLFGPKPAELLTPEEARDLARKTTQAPSDLPNMTGEAQQAYYEEKQKIAEKSGLVIPGSAPPGGVGWEEREKVKPPGEKSSGEKPTEEKPSEEPPKKGLRERGIEFLGGWASKVGSGYMATGGAIESTGSIVVHRGEEVISEQQKIAYGKAVIPSILKDIDSIKQRLSEAQYGINPAPGRGGAITPDMLTPANIIINGPIIQHAEISSAMDLEDIKAELIRFLRYEIRAAMKG